MNVNVSWFRIAAPCSYLQRRFNLLRRLAGVAAFAVLVPWTPTASAGSLTAEVIVPSPCLPPELGEYFSAFDGHFQLPDGGTVIVQNVKHNLFTICTLPPAQDDPPVFETFGSNVSFDASFGGPAQSFHAPATVGVVVMFDHESNGTSYYKTEIVQLDIAGGTLPPGVMLRESPTLPSPGITTITPRPSGDFQIESFFDIWPELSIDAGQTWVPSQESAHVVLIPEPGTSMLLALGLVGLAGFGGLGRRQQRVCAITDR